MLHLKNITLTSSARCYTLSVILPALAGVNFRFDAGVFEGDILPRGVFGVLDLGLGLLATLEKRVD